MATANNASLTTDLNVAPYYDDFNETKNFHRILYRPGLAVQARELTQQQSILQNQIDRFAEHVFKEGSVVRGGEMAYDNKIAYIKIRDDDQNGDSVTAASFANTTITGQTSGVTAYVIDSLDGSESGAPNTKTLYVRYTGSGSNNTTTAALSGEVLSNGTISANVCTEGVQASNVTGLGSRINFNSGILYAKDHFIRFDEQSTVLGRYSGNVSYKVGYTITESIVTSDSDTTLLDPAQGSYNYTAPGADRLKLTATLTAKALTDTNTEDFVERVRIKNGNIEARGDKPMYSILNEYIARRTYDESGDYIVNGLNVRMREHLNSANNGGVYTVSDGGDTNKLVVDVSPGKAYVKGFEIENLVTKHVAIDKAIDVRTVEQSSIPANYGNYVAVNEVVGTWDVNGHSRVSLYDTAMNAISNSTISSVGAVGNKIGEARVRALQYSSGTKAAADGQYNMYLYDINMSANSFSYVRSIFHDDGTNDGFADPVLVSNNAVLLEPSFNRALFEIPAENIKRLRDSTNTIDNEYRFLKEFAVTIGTNGEVTVTTGSADEQFPFSLGAINDTQERENFYVVTTATANSSTSLDSATRTQSSNTITGLTSATSKYNVGDVLKLQGDANTYIVSSVDSTTQVSVYGPGYGAALSGSTVFKAFQPGQVISLNGVGGDAAARSVTINSTTSATIDIQETLDATVAASVVCELKKVNGQEIAKNLQTDRLVELNVSDSGTTSGPWSLGVSDGFALKQVRLKTGNTFFATVSEGTDVTVDFELDTGMRDNFYDHAKLKIVNSPSHTVANGNVYLVKMDYFTHDTSSGIGYLSVDSYPIDDANTANTTAITTAEIPVFTSTVTGDRYDLRNHIDIRPRITDTANNVTTLTNISRNPAASNTIVEPANGLRYMAPNEDFITDFEYYIPRKDRIVITSRGQFRVIKGVPNLIPKAPPSPADGMTIAIVNVKAYPSLPQENAKKISTATAPYGRSDLAIKIDPIRIRRFTMKDIHGLEQRIDNLEYYTSLSLLESDTKNLFLADGSGLDRFKNGIVVDQFVDFTVADFYDRGYKAAIDKTNKELRPTFKVDDTQLDFKSANSSNVTATSKDATVVINSSAASYTEGETITQGGTSGTLVYQVDQKLYIENVSGAFTTSANVVGGDSGATSSVSSVATPAAGKLVLLPWTHEETISQDLASDTRNIAALLYSYRGSLQLSPETDYWQDVTTAPSVNIDFGFISEAIAEVANFIGIQWGGWQTTGVSSRRVDSGTLTTSTSQRTGRGINVEAGSINQTNLGDSVQNINLIPYARSRVINFTARGMKPNTRVYPFFDGTAVATYCSPANTSFANTASEGSALITDSTGNLYGNFRLPNNDQLRFPTGPLKFRLTDSITNSSALGAISTFADTTYSSGGADITTQGNIISTREIEIGIRNVSQTTSSSSFQADPPQRVSPREDDGGGDDTEGGGGDPLSQTFRVSDGIGSNIPGAFLSKVDLFFASKDATQPVEVEVREVDSSLGYITDRVVPFSKKIVEAADVNISSDGSVATPIIFETPVYLLNNVDYAMVIRPVDSNPNYKVFVARLGEDDLITNNRITEQPYTGILFASANDRAWTALQEEDLKFKMYFANFSTSQSGTAVFKNIDKEYFTVDTLDSPGMFDRVNEDIYGETTLTMTAPLSANVGDTVVGGTSSANGVVTDVTGSTVRVKEVTIVNKFSDAETITVYSGGIASGTTGVINSQVTPTGKLYFYDGVTQSNNIVHLSQPSGTFAANTWIRGQVSALDARIASVDNLKIDTFKAFMSKFELQDTTTALTAKLATSSTALDTSFRNANINDDTEYDSRRYILSRSNETTGIAGSKSAEFRVTLTNGSNRRHSPAIDNDRTAIIGVENLINNDATNEDTTGNGNAEARYIQKTITLDDGQDAEDLKVFLAAYKPSTADIKVYVKLLSADDGETMEDKTWIELTQVTSATVVSDSENTEDFNEYEYTIPTAYLTGTSGEVQYTDSNSVTYTGFKRFKIKVVLLSTTPSRVPRIKDYRVVALQI